MATVRANAQLDATWKGGNATRSASRDINGLEKDSQKASTGFGGLSKAVGLAAVGFTAAAAAGATLARGLVTVTNLAAEQQRVEAQLAATLESTGHAAGMSADELKKLAADLQTMTTYGDEAIIASESLLLTFTQIGRDTFPRAQTAILDMATAMGTDLKAATIQVGKALNDPIAGVSALAESGIQFTEAQKDVIRSLVETGDTAAAQAIILKELETQFGGSASAAADTFGGRMTQLQNIIGDVGEEIGMQLLPAMTKIAEEAGPAILSAVQELQPEIRGFGQAVSDAADALVPLIRNTARWVEIGRISARVGRGIVTLGGSELVRAYRNAAAATNDYSDAIADLRREWELTQQEGIVVRDGVLELTQAQYDALPPLRKAAVDRAGFTLVTDDAVLSTDKLIRSTSELTAEQVEANRQYLISQGLIVGWRTNTDAMAESHDQLAPAVKKVKEEVQGEAEAVEQLWRGFEKLNPAISGGFVEAMDLSDGKLTSLQEATQNADTFILNLAGTLGATGEEMGYLAEATGVYTQAQIDAAVKAIEFETRLAALKQKFADGAISVYQFRDGVRDLIAEINGLQDKTVTVTVNTVENGRVVTNNTANAGGLSEFDNPVPGRAIGGPVRAGQAYMVGESGPELFVPPMAGTVLSNGDTKSALGGANIGTVNIYITQPNATPAQITSAVADGMGRRLRG